MVAWGPQILCKAFWRALLFKMLKNSFDFFSRCLFFVESSISSKKILLFLQPQFPVVSLHTHLIIFANHILKCQKVMTARTLKMWAFLNISKKANKKSFYNVPSVFGFIHSSLFVLQLIPSRKTFFVNGILFVFSAKGRKLNKTITWL